mmetsp:Transcript_8674/g.22580  ORF Transcript_8674/g.22580 Transcript_8674/m.22580 type:complete len:309 (-) Transcript_8674:218-1144(-)
MAASLLCIGCWSHISACCRRICSSTTSSSPPGTNRGLPLHRHSLHVHRVRHPAPPLAHAAAHAVAHDPAHALATEGVHRHAWGKIAVRRLALHHPAEERLIIPQHRLLLHSLVLLPLEARHEHCRAVPCVLGRVEEEALRLAQHHEPVPRRRGARDRGAAQVGGRGQGAPGGVELGDEEALGARRDQLKHLARLRARVDLRHQRRGGVDEPVLVVRLCGGLLRVEDRRGKVNVDALHCRLEALDNAASSGLLEQPAVPCGEVRARSQLHLKGPAREDVRLGVGRRGHMHVHGREALALRVLKVAAEDR